MINPAHTELADRAALVALCFLLAVAVAMRLFNCEGGLPATEGMAAVESIDLGGGVTLPRSAAARREVLLGGCWTPVIVNFVEPSPHGRDASLDAPLAPADRVFYAYRGWILDGRLAVVRMSLLHFAWRAGAVMRMDGIGVRNELAVKVTLPAECEAEPEDALAALRKDVQTWR